MSEGMLYIDQLNNFPDAKIKIRGFMNGPREVITAYITSEISLSGEAQYSEPSGLMSGAQETLSKPIESFQTIGHLMGKLEGTQKRITSVKDSIMNWRSSPNFPLSIPLVFIAIRPEDDVRKDVSTVLSALYPDYDPSKIAEVAEAPNQFVEYNPENSSQGKLSVKIGQWFRSSKIFILQGGDFTLSQQVTSQGFPLYASGSINLISDRMLNYEDIQEMLG